LQEQILGNLTTSVFRRSLTRLECPDFAVRCILAFYL